MRSPDGEAAAAPPAGGKRAKETVLSQDEVGESSRTIAVIKVVAHASPRWKSAESPAEADANNRRLSEERGESTRQEVEQLLRGLMPDRDLVVEYQFESREVPPDPMQEEADVLLETEARGSGDTLTEAGQRGRSANDSSMRRVDVSVNLRTATETEVEERVETRKKKSGSTKEWGLWLGGEAGVEAGAKVGGITLQLRNKKTGKTGTYHGWVSGGGAGVGFSIAQTSMPDFESFTTDKRMSFSDFDGARFVIRSAGIGLIVGLEWQKLNFLSFVGGQPVPDGISVGGLNFGAGAEINLFTAVYGTMFLTDNPPETYEERTESTRSRVYTSEADDESSHRLYFATNSANVSPKESSALLAYLAGVVEPGF